MEIADLQRAEKELGTKLQEMNRKRQAAEDRHSQLKNSVVPKLNKARDSIDNICRELQRIREDADLLPDMFKKEKKDNIQYKSRMEEAIKKKDEAVGERAGLISKKEDLDLEVSRKIRLAQQAIGARQGMMK